MPEFIGEDVIGDQAPVVPQLAGGQRGQDRVEVAGDRAFADLDQQAEIRMGPRPGPLTGVLSTTLSTELWFV